MESDELPLKQEFISNLLGTWRASVGPAATDLQAQKLIRYSRGRISILKRKELEEFACECYRAVNGEADRRRIGAQVNGNYARYRAYCYTPPEQLTT